MYYIYHFIRHLPTYLKFYITNRRYKKQGYRKFKFKLFEEREKKQGGGFLKLHNIIIKASNYEEAYFKLRDEHHSIFEKGDHLTWKEII